MHYWRKSGRFAVALFYLAIALYGTYFLLFSHSHEFSLSEKAMALLSGWSSAGHKLLTWRTKPERETCPLWFWLFAGGAGLFTSVSIAYLISISNLPHMRNYLFALLLALISLSLPLFALATHRVSSPGSIR